ncbi:MAG: hypothetical protein IJL00_00910 [Clostridia bacterium]|nr:hypothetical protein [Clostridia bacterium]
MMICKEIPMKLPSLNEYIAVCRCNKYKAAKFKRDIDANIALYLRDLPQFDEPIEIHFVWIESNRRRDYDNVASAKKFILDALVKSGKLKDDNRKCVKGFRDSFDYGPESKVILFIKEAKLWQQQHSASEC